MSKKYIARILGVILVFISYILFTHINYGEINITQSLIACVIWTVVIFMIDKFKKK